MTVAVPAYYTTFLRDLTVTASIGIHAFERTARQTLRISVTLILPLPVETADDIAGVHDYDVIRDGIRALAEARHFNLQETLCGAILDLCLAAPEVLGAVVRTEKPDVYPDSDAVGCRMARFRDPSLAAQAWWAPTP